MKQQLKTPEHFAYQAKIVSMGVCATLVGATIAGAAGLSVQEASRRLTGGKSKEWVHTRKVLILGGDKGACESGEVWRFATKGRVRIERCVKGKLQSTVTTWRLRKINDLDMEISVGGRKYLLLLPAPKTEEAVQQMRLRIVSTEKPVATTDLRFTHEAD